MSESHMEGRMLCDSKTKLCVSRWSSFNQNYKGLAGEQMDLQYVEKCVWRDAGMEE